VTALLDQLEAGARFRRGRDYSRRAGGDEWGEVRGQDEGESIERRRLVLVRTLDLPFTRFVHMGVIVMMRIQMRVDNPATVDVLKRRQKKGGHECQTALERYRTPHQPQCTSIPARDIAELATHR
jgi:hypothetical protein